MALARRWRHVAAAGAAERTCPDICDDLDVAMCEQLFTAQHRVVGSMLGAPEPAHMLY